MEVRNCIRCKRMFVYVGRKLCPECREEDERDFDRVREYLRRNENAPLEEIHENTGVEREKILEFLREGRLEVNKGGITPIKKCEICGNSVNHGRICPTCLQQFRSPLKKDEGKRKADELGSGRMHIQDMWDKKGR